MNPFRSNNNINGNIPDDQSHNASLFNPIYVERPSITNNYSAHLSLSAPNVGISHLDSHINNMLNNQPHLNRLSKVNTHIQPNLSKAQYVPCNLDETNLQLDVSLVTKEYMDLAEELKCPICLNLVLKPKECKSCSTVFCGNCIDEWCKKKSNNLFSSRSSPACPMKCAVYVESPINKRFLNIINKIKVMCPNTTLGCNEILPYEETMKHVRSCNYIEYKCVGCSFSAKKSAVELHVKTCADLTEPCQLCKTEVLRKQKHMHTEICMYRPVTCRFCKVDLTLKTMKLHNREDCALKIIENYERANIEKKINTKFFANIYTSTMLNFQKNNLVPQNQHVMERTDMYEFHYRKGHIPKITNDLITIIELSNQITFKTIEVLIDINNEKGNIMPETPFVLKVHTSLEGINWNEVAEMKIATRPLESFKIECTPSNAQFILFNSQVPFRVLYFKLVA
jgi:hypothetical protein